MKKLNKKQKEHIKKAFLKGLHVICYILSAAFLILMVIVGAQSCQNRRSQRVSAESLSYNGNYSYQLRDVGVVAMSQSDFEHYNDLFDLTNENVEEDYTIGTEEVFTYSLPTGTTYYDVTNNVIVEVYNLTYTFKVKSASTHVYYWRLDRLGLTGNDGTYYSLLLPYSNSANDYYLKYVEDDIYITSSYYFYDINAIDLFMWGNELNKFTFNKSFNYNAPMLVSVNSPYGTGVTGGTSQGTLYTSLVVYTGYFVSNGEVYDQIEFWYMLSDGLSFDYDGDIKQGPQGMWSYWCTYYTNTDTNTMVIVNHRDSVAYMPSSNTYGYYQANSSTWTIDSYRNIIFLNGLSDSNKNLLEQFNNNNQYSYSGNVVSGDINNIFTLIASAFTSWIPIMSVYLLPGITIGTLIFIPLVAMLVFAIIRIIKK